MMAMTALATMGALRVDTYSNGALHGTPSTSSVSSFDFTLTSLTNGSAEVSGRLAVQQTSYFAFDCSFAGGQFVFVWIDDHLICHTDPPFSGTPSGTDGSPENPLHYVAGESKHVLVHILSASGVAPGQPPSVDAASVRVRWAQLAAPVSSGTSLSYKPIPAAALSNGSSALELRRRAMQRGLASGWGLWTHNLLSLVRLPGSEILTFGLCQRSSGACLNETSIDHTPEAAVRVGPYATDASYMQMYVGFRGVNVSISVTGGTDLLTVLVEPIGCAPPHTAGASRPSATTAATAVNCSDYSLSVTPRFGWSRPGTSFVAFDGRIWLSPQGLPGSLFGPTTSPLAAVEGQLPGSVRFPLTAPIGFVEDDNMPIIEEVQSGVASARASELARYAAYGALSEVKEALQAAVMWNLNYNPAEYGPSMPHTDAALLLCRRYSGATTSHGITHRHYVA